MSIFICLGFKNDANSALNAARSYRFRDVSNTPIGRATLGNASGGFAFLITNNISSTDLIKPTHRRNDDRSNFLSFVSGLMVDQKSMYFLYHDARGWISNEVVTVKRKIIIPLQDFISKYDLILEDTRYVIIPGLR